jgi:UDP:flavonoid glycosyltransferase YjiC (YdhE family)
MANLLYAWEFGAGLGHIGAFLPLARALRAQGHRVDWCVIPLPPVASLLEQERFSWTPAPQAEEQARAGPPLSYPDILLRFGYDSADRLGALVRAWRNAMQAGAARIVLADHAPTALLAARTLGLPAFLYSSGFCVPPRVSPAPNMRPWLAVPPQQLQALEDAALASINAVLADHGRPSVTALWQLFAVTEDTLLGFPELDHYAERGTARYWGGLPDAGVGTPPPWPDLPGNRLFAYLRSDCRHHEAALAALHELGLPTLVFFPDLPAELESRFAAPHLVFNRTPVDLDAAAASAMAAVTYGSLSTTTRFLLAGKPVLLLPWHLEQYLLARRIVDLGAGFVIDPERPPAGLAAALRRVVAEPGFAAAAQAFARKYAAFPQETVLANLVRRIEEIVASSHAADELKEKQ